MKLVYKIILTIGLLAAIVALVVFSLNRNPKTDITVTFYPLYDFTHQIVGKKLSINNITPPGAEPHDFEPTAQQLANTFNSQVFIYNGVANFEPWLKGFLPDYKNTSINSTKNINIENNDPHFWLDPILAKQAVDNILQGLIKAYPEQTAFFTANANNYKFELDKLDAEFKTGLTNCQSRTIVTSHEAFGYLADRYDLNIVAISGLNPDQEPSPAQLAEIAKIVKDQNVKYIFLETLAEPRLADTIANETGAQTAILDPIEGITNEDQAQGKNYLSIQRQNLVNIRTALACQ